MATFKDDLTIKFGADASEFNKELNKLVRDTEKSISSVNKVVNTSAVVFTGLAAAVGVVSKSFIEYEKGLIAVQKTSNLSDEATAELGDDLINLSKKAPLAIKSLLEIAETAGQLGVEGAANILKFTETVTKLETTTNLQGGEAAKTLARILKLTGDDVSNVDKLGSAFVRLGNTVAASEVEIAGATGEIAKATSIYKIGTANTVALGASLAELGVQAEIGSSVTGRAFEQIKLAIDKGGDSLKELSNVTGITTANLKKDFEKDATGVFVKFLGSIKKVVDSGGNVNLFLEKFGLKGAGVSKVLAPLANNISSLQKNLKNSNAEFKNATALVNEFAKSSSSLSAQLTTANNKLDAAKTKLGEQLAPVVVDMTTKLANLVDAFASLDTSTIKIITNVILFATKLAGLVLGISLAVKAFLAIKLGMIAFGGVITALAAKIFIFLAVTGPLGLLIAGVSAAAVAVGAAWALMADDTEKANDEITKNVEQNAKKREILRKKEADKALADTKADNQKRLDEIRKLNLEKKRLLQEFSKVDIEADKKTALQQLEIEKTKFEKKSLEQQGASEETLALKQSEIDTLQNLQNLERENAIIAAKSEKTALELITREKNKILIDEQQLKLNTVRDQQLQSNEQIFTDVSEFEDRTRELIVESFDKKLENQVKALADIEQQLTSLDVKGSYPNQEKLLDKSLVNQSKSTEGFYKKELQKREGYLRTLESMGYGDSYGDSYDYKPTGQVTTTHDSSFFDPNSSIFDSDSTLPPPSVAAPVTESPPNAPSAAPSASSTAPSFSQSAPQTIKVDLSLKGDLVNFISAEQRKQSDLGISRQ